jgi:hypothetical protein
LANPQRVDVGGQIAQIALSSTGRVFALTTDGELACIDLTEMRLWERNWGLSRPQQLSLRLSDQGRPWVNMGGVLIEVDHDGSDLKSPDVARDDDERLGSFLLAAGGIYACLYRPGAPVKFGPTVTRLDPSGSTLWATTLPLGPIGYEGVVEIGIRTGWETKPKQPWRPRTWEPIRYGGSEPLLLSGDRLLASFFELRSGIGCSYCLDAGSGHLLWMTDPAPTHTLAIASTGHFYHGLQGYGAFETRLLGPDGAVLTRWNSHGYVVVDEQGTVRSVEMENRLPSRMRFATLQDDGSVSDGPLLDGYHTTYPAISREGISAFWRNGELILIHERRVKEVIYSDPTASNEGVMSRMLLSPNGFLVFSVGREVWIVDAGLGSMAESPWPCGGGTLQNNPVWI